MREFIHHTSVYFFLTFQLSNWVLWKCTWNHVQHFGSKISHVHGMQGEKGKKRGREGRKRG